ncbi:agmatinase family protein [Thermoactinomyces sp. AMNI-1]|uniref:Agmatinase family protein n=2 Tax=Thermoactinomyces mirandus TaxID=2756294 RepID=A0A7W1XS36_9BACL|nr:agmatinase family protein [Thermoactinomyces mirandus]
MGFQYLAPPPFVHQSEAADPNDVKVSEWIQPWDGKEQADVGVIGIPLSRSSISASAASESPWAIRQSWRYFSAYDVDHDIDLTRLKVRDLGDIRMHTTDIPLCHRHIEKGIEEVYRTAAKCTSFLPVMIGGDHSITCPSVKAFVKAHPGRKVGLFQFDTHFDVRSLKSGGPSNGTPIRGLLESGMLRGQYIVQVGIHGFANSKIYRDYADEQGIIFYTMHQIRKQGFAQIFDESFARLSRKVDVIYVTVDLDVLDLSFLPGSPGSSPGGLYSWELFEALHLLGQKEQVKAFDMVCLDPSRDLGSLSVRTATHTFLSFLSGVCSRKN